MSVSQNMHGECKSAPISWLTLERHGLGELDAEHARVVDEHLSHCDVCRCCFQSVQAEFVLVELPALEAPPVEAAERKPGFFQRLRWAFVVATAAAAAILLLILLPLGKQVGSELPGARLSIKGGELAITLIRNRDGVVVVQPERFLPSDAFKVEVTCPMAAPLRGDVVVVQAGELSFPLAQAAPLDCGNRKPLAGAFRLEGQADAAVCLIVKPEDGRAIDRARLKNKGVGALEDGEQMVCTKLAAAKE